MQERFPDGLSRNNIERSGGANPAPLLLLLVLLGAGLFGMFGGQPNASIQTTRGATTLKVTAPQILRSGMIFETIVEVSSRQSVDNLVIGISDPLWREMTINTMIPAAEEEENKNGFHRFSFGRLEAGDTFRFKIDGQINPPLLAGTKGMFVAFDGEGEIISAPVAVKVLP